MACVLLAGCMRIYADPELPDIKVRWNVESCRDGLGDVELVVASLDSDTELARTVACADGKATFADLARERFHVVGTLRDDGGAAFATSDSGEADLRNGFDKSASLYFDAFSNFSATWTFDRGASCASLGAIAVEVAFARPELPDSERYDGSCEEAIVRATVAPGTYTVRLRALTDELTTVAASPEAGPIEITERGLTNLGAFVLAPCGATCP